MSRAKWTCPPFLKLVGVRAGAESSAGPESTFRGKCKNGGSVFRETQNGGQRFRKASAAEPSAAVSLTFPQHLPRKKSLALKRESRPSLPPIFFGGETKDPTSDVMHKIWKQDTKLGGEKVSCSQPFADLGRASYKQTFLFPKLLSRASARSSEIVNGTKALPTKRPKLQLRRGGSRVFQIRLEWWSFRSVSELVECGRIQRQFF